MSDNDLDEDGVVAIDCTGRTRSSALHSLTGAYQTPSVILFQSPDSYAMAIDVWQEYFFPSGKRDTRSGGACEPTVHREGRCKDGSREGITCLHLLGTSANLRMWE